MVALNIGDYDSSAVSDVLSQDYGIATRPGAHCAPRMHEALGTTELGAVRFSFSWFNTEEEVDAAIAAMRRSASEARPGNPLPSKKADAKGVRFFLFSVQFS